MNNKNGVISLEGVVFFLLSFPIFRNASQLVLYSYLNSHLFDVSTDKNDTKIMHNFVHIYVLAQNLTYLLRALKKHGIDHHKSICLT